MREERAYTVIFNLNGHTSHATVCGAGEQDAKQKCRERFPGAQPTHAIRCDKTADEIPKLQAAQRDWQLREP